MLRSVRVTLVLSLKRFWVILPPPQFGFRAKKENVEQLRFKPCRACIGRFWRLAMSGCERMKDIIDGKEVWIEHGNLDKFQILHAVEQWLMPRVFPLKDASGAKDFQEE